MTDIARVKSNIGKMIDQGAGEAEIDAYLKGEGVDHAALQPKVQQTAIDKLIGRNGPRFQTWPERAVREVLSVPEQVMQAAASAPAGSSDLSENLAPSSLEAAMTFTPMSRANAVLGIKPQQIAAPSREALEQAASQGYEKARASGVGITPDALSGIQSRITNELTDQGYVAATAPKTFGIVKEMTPPPTAPGETLGAIGVPTLEAMRRGFRRAGADYVESDASRRAIGVLDDTLSTLSPDLAKARANSAAAFRSEDIGARLERADRQAAKAGNGANLDNAIRQRISQKLDAEGGKRGLTADEIAQADKVVEGTAVGNIARILSKMSPQHPVTGWPSAVLGASVGGAAGMAGQPVLGGALAVASPTIGMIAKIVAEKSTERQARLLDEMTRRRSPLYEEQLAAAPAQLPTTIEGLARLLSVHQLENRQNSPLLNPVAVNPN